MSKTKRAGGNPANYPAVKATTASVNWGKKKFQGKNKKDAKAACCHFRKNKKGKVVPMYEEVNNRYVCRLCKAEIDPTLKTKDGLDNAIHDYVEVLDHVVMYGIAAALGSDVVTMACEQKLAVKKVRKCYKDMGDILRKYAAAKSKKRRRNGGDGTRNYGGWGSRY